MSENDESKSRYVTGNCDVDAASISLNLSHSGGFFFGSATDNWYPMSGPTLYVEVLVRDCELKPVDTPEIDSRNKAFTVHYPSGTSLEELTAACDRLIARCDLICRNDLSRVNLSTVQHDPRVEPPPRPQSHADIVIV